MKNVGVGSPKETLLGGGVESQIFLNIIMKEKIWRWGINGLTKRCGGRGVGKNL